MLTKIEMDQLEWSIKTMGGTIINDDKHIPMINVIGLLQRYTEGTKENKNGTKI